MHSSSVHANTNHTRICSPEIGPQSGMLELEAKAGLRTLACAAQLQLANVHNTVLDDPQICYLGHSVASKIHRMGTLHVKGG
jgi:hypothetical protein